MKDLRNVRQIRKPIEIGFNSKHTAFIKANTRQGDSIQRTVKNLLDELMLLKQANQGDQQNGDNN
nr:hypothetical protein [Moritella viscosa]SHO01228.1 ATP-dependent helicase/nuclease subunit A-ATP-dependent helicase/nuclease AddA [Moritella viscosa]